MGVAIAEQVSSTMRAVSNSLVTFLTSVIKFSEAWCPLPHLTGGITNAAIGVLFSLPYLSSDLNFSKIELSCCYDEGYSNTGQFNVGTLNVSENCYNANEGFLEYDPAMPMAFQFPFPLSAIAVKIAFSTDCP